MPFFTLEEVHQAAAEATGTILTEGQAAFTSQEEYFEKRAATARQARINHFDIFLSHAYKDKVVVIGLYKMLTTMGFVVYVDWIHDRHRLNRNAVSAANAAILRERLRQCDSLLYATITNHRNSLWMPWECGYFDGFDSKDLDDGIQPGHVAILPVTAKASFIGQEYLGLYPTAKKGAVTASVRPPRNLYIHNPSSTSNLHFDAWIQNGPP